MSGPCSMRYADSSHEDTNETINAERGSSLIFYEISVAGKSTSYDHRVGSRCLSGYTMIKRRFNGIFRSIFVKCAKFRANYQTVGFCKLFKSKADYIEI